MNKAISVTELNRYLKGMFDDNQLLYNVCVKGEISNFGEKSGNYYFKLKDSGAQVQCILFNNYVEIIGKDNILELKDGLEVTVTGKISLYEKAGTYAIYVKKIENTGLGDYFVKLQKLKIKLAEEGLFDESHKKKIPKYSVNVGVVTAENGAAIKDIYKTIKDKNKYAKIYLYPSKVQGDDAYKTIIEGINVLDKMKLDVIIIGRGGGSIEDLYAFNDENVARAIYNATTPIISAVGHEINDSISDLVADLRVATPTAAGEKAVFSYDALCEDINDHKEELNQVMLDKINLIKDKLENIKIQIDLLTPKEKVRHFRDILKKHNENINSLMENKIIYHKQVLKNYIEKLRANDTLQKLEKGFLYTTNTNNIKINSVRKVKNGDIIKLYLLDGSIDSKVINIKKVVYNK